MFREEFTSMMISSYAPKKNEEKRQDYIKQIEIFARKCPENHLLNMYEFAVGFGGYPKIKILFEYARELGFIIEDEKIVTKQVWYYRCDGFYKDIQTGIDKYNKPIMKKTHFSCDTDYSSKSMACPNCGSTSSQIVLLNNNQAMSDKVKLVQSQCYICSKYKPDSKGDGFRVYGPCCGVHGNFNSPENDNQCKDCVCRSCCADSREYRHAQDNYFYKKDGERRDISQDWLNPSRRPGETIKDFSSIRKVENR